MRNADKEPTTPPSRSARAVDVSPAMAVEIRLKILALEAAATRCVSMPGLDRVDEPRFDHDQPYGPMSPWVVTNARAAVRLTHLDILVAHMELVAHADPPIVTATALRMTAAGVGRSDALEATLALATRVSARLQERRHWRREVESRADDLGLSRRAARQYLADHLDAFVERVLVACALEDVMTPALRLQSLGAWRCITSVTEDDPGAEWRCTDATAATLRRFFADMDEDALVWHLSAVLAPDDPDREAIRHRLIGSTLVRAASPPPLAEIIGPGLLDDLGYRGGRSLIDQLARLLAALCQPPDWLSPQDLLIERDRLANWEIDWPPAT
ncbi:hypothetical protein [Aeromicrobium wangtongii]|uniref:hypothetical protein n=1 Tax=Aeromicrobium wangtongii TaxID=2969247 RepID=UPI002016DB9F|nr:hypothetical protein [Aeromicrobium wangtongii]MCL3818977.1 hypothetical protein [Aeromicrobium wangtongii]